jgi:seryl-tRNA synthetase
MVEKFGAEFRTVRNLGTRKARLLTRFTKEEIDTYVQGGPLKDIPHDAVAKRTFTELGTEVRRLQKKLDGQKDRHEKELAEKKNEIEHLQEIVDLRVPLSKEEEAAKRAQTELQKLTVDYTFALGKVNSSLREAFALVAKAEKIEGVNVQQLNDWIRQFDMEMDNFNTLKDGWTAEIENVGPMPDWRLSDLK